jgi:hypothetical protein
MMALTIFYSWQSDLPNKLNRGFIEDALKKAIEYVGQNIEVQEALRDEKLKMDKDTIGIPGSPPIVDTILDKISCCAIFVADLTFVGKTEGGRLIPNPNVLIEYGWALKELGHNRIIRIMNAAFGEPTWDSLPFDMRHLRFPISYSLTEETTPAEKAEIKDRLIKQLSEAIQLIIEKGIVEGNQPKPEPFQKITFTLNPARFLGGEEPLGKVEGRRILNKVISEDVDLYLGNNEQLFLRVFPTVSVESIKSSKAALEMIQNNLIPLGKGDVQLTYGRNSHGAYVCNYYKSEVLNLTQLFLNGEIWGVNAECIDRIQFKQSTGEDF